MKTTKITLEVAGEDAAAVVEKIDLIVTLLQSILDHPKIKEVVASSGVSDGHVHRPYEGDRRSRVRSK